MVEKKTCPYCGGEHERPRSRWCSDKCRWNDKVRRNGMNCATCGKRMAKTTGSAPEGVARCMECRRTERREAEIAGLLTPMGRYRRGRWIPKPMVCRCGRTFMPTHHKQRNCVPWHRAQDLKRK